MCGSAKAKFAVGGTKRTVESLLPPNLRELRLDQDLVKTSSSNQQALGAHANAALCAMATMYRRSTSTSNYQSYHPHTCL